MTDGAMQEREDMCSGSQARLIFAAHPDDETLGCAGVILRARREGDDVRVVFITHGDGFAAAASALTGKPADGLRPEDFVALGAARQRQALDACQKLGLSAGQLTFLGYPDGGLDKLGEGFVARHTGRGATYGVAVADYHTQRHGRAAPFTRAAAVDDLAEIVRAVQPGEVYVTDLADSHGDHRAAFGLVRDAAAASGFVGRVYTYLVHAVGGVWPWPRGATPDQPFEAHVENGVTVPAGIAWPADQRRAMSAADCELKLRAIRAYSLEWQLARGYIESFIKSEEVFWVRPV